MSQLWLIKDPLSQQEGTRVPSDPVNVRGSLIPTLSPIHILSALTLTQIEGTPNGCQMLRRGTDVPVVNQVKKVQMVMLESCFIVTLIRGELSEVSNDFVIFMRLTRASTWSSTHKGCQIADCAVEPI